MKIQDKYYLMKIEDYYIVLPMQESITKEKTTLTLNEKEAFLWHHLKVGTSEDELTILHAQKYGTDKNIGKAYNEAIEQLGDDNDWFVLFQNATPYFWYTSGFKMPTKGRLR